MTGNNVQAPTDRRLPERRFEAAVIEPVGGHAGMNVYNIELARGLYSAGVPNRLYTCDETPETSEPGVTVLKPFKGIYGKTPRFWRGLKFILGLCRCLGDLRRQRVTVAHLHYFQYGIRELACCVALKLLGIRVVATVHDVNPFSNPELLTLFKPIIKLSDHLIVHNHFSARMLQQKAAALPQMPPVSVINMGNFLGSTRLVDRLEAKELLALPISEPTLLFFGQIKPEKGLEELLSAFAIHKHRGGAGRLLVAGRPMANDPVDYEKKADELGITSHVTFQLAYIPEVDVGLYYSAADLILLPYREIYQSAVLIMAMSYGRAVLVSDLAPMMEVVEEGVNGLSFRAGNIDSLADVLGHALADSGRLAELGRNAAADMRDNYSWENIGARISAVYASQT